MNDWLILILSFPGRSATPRMRVWRALKAHGAAVLRDGVYLLPHSPEGEQAFDQQVLAIEEAGGAAHVIVVTARDDDQDRTFQSLFDRRADYADWLAAVSELSSSLTKLDEATARRQESQCRRTFQSIVATDFFPDSNRDAAEYALDGLSRLLNKQFSPGEPTSTHGDVPLANIADYQGKIWVTRASLWVDRVASAWLISRFIDHQAKFLWLAKPTQSPADTVGFDFDGADFTHIEERVTFEVLVASFALSDDHALMRLGSLVHCLDVGGIPVAEAPGVLALLGSARQRCVNDDDFLAAAGILFDDLYTAYTPR